MIVALVVLAGGFGAAVRFVVDGAVKSRVGDAFPWGTVLINISGSFVLGVLTGLVVFRGGSDDLRLVLGTGFCGGYTTFGTASFETITLARDGGVWRAVANGLGTLVLAVATGSLGLVLTA